MYLEGWFVSVLCIMRKNPQCETEIRGLPFPANLQLCQSHVPEGQVL
jgi:hypothetical protein